MSYDYSTSCRTTITSHVVRHDNLMKARHKMFGIRCWCGMWNEVYIEYDIGLSMRDLMIVEYNICRMWGADFLYECRFVGRLLLLYNMYPYIIIIYVLRYKSSCLLCCFFSCLAKDVQYSSKKYINISNDSCIFVTVNPIS